MDLLGEYFSFSRSGFGVKEAPDSFRSRHNQPTLASQGRPHNSTRDVVILRLIGAFKYCAGLRWDESQTEDERRQMMEYQKWCVRTFLPW